MFGGGRAIPTGMWYNRIMVVVRTKGAFHGRDGWSPSIRLFLVWLFPGLPQQQLLLNVRAPIYVSAPKTHLGAYVITYCFASSFGSALRIYM